MQVLPFLWQSSLKAVLCKRVVNAASIRCWQRRQSYKNFHNSAKTCSQRRVYVLRGCQSLRVRAKNKELQRKYKLLKKIFIFQSNHCSKTALLFPSSLIGAPDGWCQNLSRSVRLLCVLGQKPSEQTAWFAHFQELPTQPQQFRLWELKTFKILRKKKTFRTATELIDWNGLPLLSHNAMWSLCAQNLWLGLLKAKQWKITHFLTTNRKTPNLCNTTTGRGHLGSKSKFQQFRFKSSFYKQF